MEQKIKNIEESANKALNTLAQGIADNMSQLWDNQTALTKALSDMSESFEKALKEIRDEKKSCSCSECKG